MASRRKQQRSEIQLKVFRPIIENPTRSSRQVANEIGISNGVAYSVLTALLQKGIVKLGIFRNSLSKRHYAYLLTATGVRGKSHLTHRFIKRKLREFEELKTEISALQEEAGLVGARFPVSQALNKR